MLVIYAHTHSGQPTSPARVLVLFCFRQAMPHFDPANATMDGRLLVRPRAKTTRIPPPRVCPAGRPPTGPRCSPARITPPTSSFPSSTNNKRGRRQSKANNQAVRQSSLGPARPAGKQAHGEAKWKMQIWSGVLPSNCMRQRPP